MKKKYPTDIMDFMMNYLHKYFFPPRNKKIEDSDDLSLVLRAHLLAELLMDMILKRNVKSQRRITRQNLTFNVKLTIIDSFRLIPEKLISVLEALNSVRNQFAHDLRTSLENIDFDIIVKKCGGSPVPKKVLWSVRRRYKSKHDWKRFLFTNAMGGCLTDLVHRAFGWKKEGEIDIPGDDWRVMSKIRQFQK